MSLEISIASRAEQDMTLQYRWYLENADFDVAERYLLAVDETIQSIAGQPDLGIRRHFAAPELARIESNLSTLRARGRNAQAASGSQHAVLFEAEVGQGT